MQKSKNCLYLSYMKKSFKCIKIFMIKRKNKENDIQKAFFLYKIKIQKTFTKCTFINIIRNMILKQISSQKKQKFIEIWRKYAISSKENKSIRELQLQNIESHLSLLKKRQFYSYWKDYHRKVLTNYLINSKYINFYNKKQSKKVFEMLYYYYIKQTTKKRKISQSILQYHKNLKSFSMFKFKNFHKLIVIKHLQLLKSLKFWSNTRKKNYFNIIKGKYKEKKTKKMNYKEAKECRKTDIQEMFIKKWCKVGIYWKEKQEEENCKFKEKHDEKVWRLVQKIAYIWLSKIRKKRNVLEKPTVLVPIQTGSKQTPEIDFSIKSRPAPRRLENINYYRK